MSSASEPAGNAARREGSDAPSQRRDGGSAESGEGRSTANGNGHAVADAGQPHIVVKDLTMAFGDFVVMKDLNFTVNRGDVFVIMGGSGCGKSTLLKHMIGLIEPAKGEVLYGTESFTKAPPEVREKMLRRFGVLYQTGGLWTSMTLAENVGLPLTQFTDLSRKQIEEVAALKLALVGLAGFEAYYPAQISGGMQKRAGLARAMALDPEILFFDEPSSGLDPISSRLLDDLIMELRESLGATVVVVTHELASIFTIANNSVFLDADTRTMIAQGNPSELRDSHPDPKVRRFLTRASQLEENQAEANSSGDLEGSTRQGHVEEK
jgi:phospholipid/cholesterol/gamma-HCH transport system ATP-binding protein